MSRKQGLWHGNDDHRIRRVSDTTCEIQIKIEQDEVQSFVIANEHVVTLRNLLAALLDEDGSGPFWVIS